MAICDNCEKEYITYDSDAGTYAERFCSEACEAEMEQRIDEWINSND